MNVNVSESKPNRTAEATASMKIKDAEKNKSSMD